MRVRLALLAATTAVALAAAATPATASAVLAGPSPGAPGAGDPYFPLQGNGGYDVRDYGLDLRYDPATRRLDGTAAIVATATQALSRFDLDLRGFTVRSVTVNGKHASFTPVTVRS